MTFIGAYIAGLATGLILASFFWFVSCKVLKRCLAERKGGEE